MILNISLSDHEYDWINDYMNKYMYAWINDGVDDWFAMRLNVCINKMYNHVNEWMNE